MSPLVMPGSRHLFLGAPGADEDAASRGPGGGLVDLTIFIMKVKVIRFNLQGGRGGLGVRARRCYYW